MSGVFRVVARFQGVTIDFYETLVRGRHGSRSRGQRFVDYVANEGLNAAPWEHQILYDIFDTFGRDYNPTWLPPRKNDFWVLFTQRVFKRANVRGDGAHDLRRHAEAVRDIFGPRHFELFPDAIPALRRLLADGYVLGIVSNWQKGLAHFCSELGIREYFKAIVSSAEVGVEKPDPAIFREASRLLGVKPMSLMHIGDRPDDDVRGATEAGLTAVWLNRWTNEKLGYTIRSLTELSDMLRVNPKTW
jgi:HAD superfamily hydrolase (TIGR01549 family)